MDKKELFDTVINLEEQIGSLYRQLGDLKQHIGEMIEENHHLQLENKHLRKRLDDTTQQIEKFKADKKESKTQKTEQADIGKDMIIWHVCIRKDSISVTSTMEASEKKIVFSVCHS